MQNFKREQQDTITRLEMPIAHVISLKQRKLETSTDLQVKMAGYLFKRQVINSVYNKMVNR